MNALSTAPFVRSRAIEWRDTPLIVAHVPPTIAAPSGCVASIVDLAGRVSDEATLQRSGGKTREILRGWPLTVLKPPPNSTCPSPCTATANTAYPPRR